MPEGPIPIAGGSWYTWQLFSNQCISTRRVRRRANAIQRGQPRTKIVNMISLIIEGLSGAVGGNIAGTAMKENTLGTVGNSIAGIVGGGLGGALLHSVLGGAAEDGLLDLTTILSNVAGGGAGGAILMALIGFIKNATAKK